MKSSNISLSVDPEKLGIEGPHPANKLAKFDIIRRSGALQSEWVSHLEETNPSV
jgi:hypothetical protein